MIEYVPIEEIARRNAEAGAHWFDPDTKRFFRSLLPRYAFSGQGGIFFVSSEQFDDRSPRLYSVREAKDGGARIDTVGDFQSYKSRSGAVARARALAEGSAP